MKLKTAELFVLIAIMVGGLASSPVFNSIGAVYAQTDDVDDMDSDEMETDTEEHDEMETDTEEHDAMDDKDKDYDKDSVRYHDRKCWETDSGELRCEGHDGKCMRTDDGIRCEVHDYKRDIKMMLDKYCNMTDEERDRFLSEHDYFREHHDRIANYCEMSEDEREDFRETHHDMMMDFKERHHDMVGQMKDKHSDIRMQKMMQKHGEITEERMSKLKEKFRMHHSDLTDEQRDALRDKIKDKYADHFKMKFKARHDALSDQYKADLLKRHAEMKAYKEELRERYQQMTDDEKEQFKMDFYSKAKDMRHAWLSPRVQMMAGISVDEIECREGLNLVMLNSNGKPLCMKSSTAEKLIERGIVVPAS